MHPHKFEPTITNECSLCHGHYADGTKYLKLDMETWDGPDAILCGKCIDAMHSTIHEEPKKGKANDDKRKNHS